MVKRSKRKRRSSSDCTPLENSRNKFVLARNGLKVAKGNTDPNGWDRTPEWHKQRQSDLNRAQLKYNSAKAMWEQQKAKLGVK